MSAIFKLYHSVCTSFSKTLPTCVLCKRLSFQVTTKNRSLYSYEGYQKHLSTPAALQQRKLPSLSHYSQNTGFIMTQCNWQSSRFRNHFFKTFLVHKTRPFSLDYKCLFQYRQVHTLSTFSLENLLYDSYLQSLLNESREFETESSQFSQEMNSETKKLEYTGRIQFLQAASEVIQRLYEKQQEIQELKQMMESEENVEMKQLMEKELASFTADLADVEDELVNVLVGDDPADRNGVIFEASAGVGGQEAMLFCAEVFNMYLNYGIVKGWDVKVISKDDVELGGYRKASMEISGLDVYKYLKHEAGVHRVQRVPKTERAGRVHTSTISVSVLPQPREVDIEIEKKDLKIETFRGSGPGGQSVNTTDSAVRITHLPTGTVSECRQERSQIKNRDLAMKKLKLRMYQIQLDKEEMERRATRKMQMGTRGRSEKIRTYNFQQDRITDHRAKESQSNLLEFMSGGEDLDNMILKVAQEYKYQTLESMLDEFELSLKKNKKH